MSESRVPRVVLLTSLGRRHRYAGRRLAAALDLAGIVSEPKKPGAATGAGPLTERHLGARDRSEERLLGDPTFPTEVERLSVEPGAINTQSVREWVHGRNPQFVLLYGTSIVRPPLLTDYPGRMINLHLGLSPYYRGAGTNFWPLVHRRPECVGSTVHLAVERVDAGDILAQSRPDMAAGDGPHDIGTRALMAGLSTMVDAVLRYAQGGAAPQPQVIEQGQVFRRRDVTDDAVEKMYRNFQTGMIWEYLEDRLGRDARYPIVALSRAAGGI